jgi:hypothetical protein
MPYFPDVTVIMGLARVHRERVLPPGTVPRATHTLSGQQVEPVTVVLEGDVLKDYRILDVARHFKITAAEGQRAQIGQELARRGKGRRAKVLASPATGHVVRIEDGRIILQLSERTVEVESRLSGTVEEASDFAVKITGVGAVLQCAWGNGGFRYQPYKFLPPDGFVGLSKVDVRISEYRNVVIISPHPLNKGDLLVAQQQQVAGVVAPSMASNLREFALGLTFPVLLTEGFGHCRPTALIYNLLHDNMGRQAAFDAAVPNRWTGERPEITIPLPAGGILPPTPALDQQLEIGAPVRMTRAPLDGLIGDVVDLPDTPQVIENGLRLPCAKVRLPNQRVELVPLANLELLGTPADESESA